MSLKVLEPFLESRSSIFAMVFDSVSMTDSINTSFLSFLVKRVMFSQQEAEEGLGLQKITAVSFDTRPVRSLELCTAVGAQVHGPEEVKVSSAVFQTQTAPAEGTRMILKNLKRSRGRL